LNHLWFPKIGLPPNHPFIDGFSTINYYKPSILRGTPIDGNPPYTNLFYPYYSIQLVSEVVLSMDGRWDGHGWTSEKRPGKVRF